MTLAFPWIQDTMVMHSGALPLLLPLHPPGALPLLHPLHPLGAVPLLHPLHP